MSEKQFSTPIKVKKEKLASLGHTITPIKLEESQGIIDEGLSIDEVVQILNGNEDYTINELHHEALEVILEVWRKRYKMDTTTIVNLSREQILMELEDMAEDSDEEIDKKVDDIYTTVKAMNISAATSDEEILKYSHIQRSRFIYWLQLKRDGKVVKYDELLESPEEFVIERLKEWRNQQKPSELDVIMEDSSVDEDELYSSKEQNDHTETSNILSTFSEVHENKSSNPTNKPPETKMKTNDVTMKDPPETEVINTSPSPAPTATKISLETTDKYLDSATIETMQQLLFEHYSAQESTISKDIIKVYSKKYLLKTIKEIRDKMKPKSSSLKQKTKYSKPVQADLQMKTHQSWRYSINFTLSDEIKGTDGLRDYLSDILHEMVSYCPGLVLLLWNTDEHKGAIDDCENLPTTITHLQKYFEGIRSPAGMSRMYARFRLGIPIKQNRQTLEADIIGWAKAKEIRIFECSVQHPRVKTCCWAVYLSNSVDKEKWCRAVQTLYSTFMKDKSGPVIQLGLVWRALNGQTNIDRKKKIYAMHVDAPRHQSSKVKQFLRMLAQNNKFLPLGIRFRVMDEYTQYMSDTTKAKYRYMVSKHKTFLAEIKQVNTDAIISLDKKIGDSKMTVRDLVNNYKDIKDGKRIFSTINSKWNDAQTHIALFRPDKTAQAYAFIQSISTYVYHTFPTATNLHKIFTVEAIEQAKSEQYHPGTQTFVTQDQLDLDKEIQADLDDDWFDFCKVNENPFEIDISNTKLVGGDRLYTLSGDDDTASTVPATSSQISFSSNINSVHHYDPSVSSDTISISSPSQSQPSVEAASSLDDKASDVAADA